MGGAGLDNLRGNGGVDVLNGGTTAGDDNESDRVLGGSHTDFATFGDGDRFDMGSGIDELTFTGTRGGDVITVDFRLASNLPRSAVRHRRRREAGRLRQRRDRERGRRRRQRHDRHESGGGGRVVARFIGGSGNDLLIGGNLNDVLSGGTGGDTLIGLGGDDELDFGSGRNVVIQ